MNRSSSWWAALAVVAMAATAQAQSNPQLPANLEQWQADGVTLIPPGGMSTSMAVQISCTVGGSFPPSTAFRMVLEVQPMGAPFTNVPNYFGNWVQNNQTSRASVISPGSGPGFHWQVRNAAS